MKTRLLALVLALCLALGLCACAPKEVFESTAEPFPSAEDTLTPSVEPSEPVAEPEPSDGGEMTTDAPSQAPEASATATPSDKPATPSATPAPTPEATAEPAHDWTAADIYAMWLTTSSQFPAPGSSFTDMSSFASSYYSLSDVEDFVFYQDTMSAAPREVFLAKAKPGKASAVKSTCQDRLADLQEETKDYAGTDNYVATAKLETVGDWVVFAACADNDRLVKTLKDAVK